MKLVEEGIRAMQSILSHPRSRWSSAWVFIAGGKRLGNTRARFIYSRSSVGKFYRFSGSRLHFWCDVSRSQLIMIWSMNRLPYTGPRHAEAVS